MAQKAEEYGSHDKTFEIPGQRRRASHRCAGKVLLEHTVEAGRYLAHVPDQGFADSDWVKLAVKRARLTGHPAVFWLDRKRAHDAKLITKVETYLKDHDTNGLDILDHVTG